MMFLEIAPVDYIANIGRCPPGLGLCSGGDNILYIEIFFNDILHLASRKQVCLRNRISHCLFLEGAGSFGTLGITVFVDVFTSEKEYIY